MRILIVDDEPAVHDSYRRCFAPVGADPSLAAMATALFGEGTPAPSDEPPVFECTHHTQGADAVAEVARAMAAGDPFAVAFIDIRMPPGIDGKETARRIRALDPDVHLVIVTGYSDFSPIEISRAAGPADKIFYIAKPFEVAEIVQTATALGQRWANDRALAETRAALARHVAQLEETSAELAANESRAIHLANHDALTDAPNRLAFQRALAARARHPDPFAVAMIDVDRFKLVNDTLGHLAGDELIRAICATLQRVVPAGGLVARLGGDEFGLLFDAADDADALKICERIVAACGLPVRLLGHEVNTSVSAGVVTVGEGDSTDLMRRADLALNDAKRDGRNIARLFDPQMDEGLRVRRRIERDLGQAIARDQLSLAYQPIVAQATGEDGFEVVGFEALMRWSTEDYGPISPALFIPIAEESELIHALGDWVLDQSLAVLGEWPGQYVSVNFSPRQFSRPNFVGYIMERVQRAGIAPARLQIEITETAIFDDVEHAAETLYKLRQMGFRIALDDFGTGYSSLYNIRKFALDSLKIDRSFVDGMGRERESAAIVQSIIHLGKALGLGIIAEGVETEAQVALLRVAGASHLQGYHFSRPVHRDLARDMAAARFLGRPEAAPATGTHG